MKLLVGILAAIAVYVVIWFIQTILPVDVLLKHTLIIMGIAFICGYSTIFYLEYALSKNQRWLDKALKAQHQ
jgi:hypothetical protein